MVLCINISFGQGVEICGNGIDDDGDLIIDNGCEICGNNYDDDGDGEVDEGCYNFCNRQDNIWYFGAGTGLNFNDLNSNGLPAILTNGGTNVVGGCASLSDAYGRSVFHTDGIGVFLNDFSTPNSFTPFNPAINGQGGESNHAALIVPTIGLFSQQREYLIVTAGDFEANETQGLQISGRALLPTPGNYTSIQPIPLRLIHETFSTQKQLLVRHATNCNDYWILSHTFAPAPGLNNSVSGDEYLAYLVNQTWFDPIPLGLSNPLTNGAFNPAAVVSDAGTAHVNTGPITQDIDRGGQMAISRQNDRIANALLGSRIIDVLYFDAGTGQVSNTNVITLSVPSLDPLGFIYGVNFSPDGRYLFVTRNEPSSIPSTPTIFRFDLISNDEAIIQGTRTDVSPVPAVAGAFGQILPTPVGDKLAIASAGQGVYFMDNFGGVPTYDFLPLPQTQLGLSATVPDFCEPDITLTKTVSNSNPVAGDDVIYTITLCNNTDQQITFNVQDALPPDLVLANKFTFDYDAANNVLSQTVTLAPNECRNDLIFSATVALAQGDCPNITPNPITNTVTASIDHCYSISADVTINPIMGFQNIGTPGTNTNITSVIGTGPNQILPSGSTIPQRLFIQGTLVINQPHTFHNAEIVMDEGARILINGGMNLQIFTSHLHGCDHFWKGIELANIARVRIIDSRIEDAEYAIKLNTFSIINVEKTIFSNNYVGIYAPPSNIVKTVIGTTLGCVFEGTGILKSIYSGQTTTPNTYPYAGILLYDLYSFSLLNYATPNIFQNMSAGLLAEDVNLKIENAIFKNMHSSYPGLSNYGIVAHSSTGSHKITQKGFGGTSGNTRSIENVKYGILLLRMNFDISSNHIFNTDRGIISTGAIDKDGKIEKNYIEGGKDPLTTPGSNATNSSVAIWMTKNDPMKSLKINENTIVMPKGLAGIILDESKKGLFETEYVRKNNITLQDTRRGISLQNQYFGIIADNEITLANTAPGSRTSYPDRTGLFTGRGYDQAISCNIIRGGHPDNAFDLELHQPMFFLNNNKQNFGLKVDMTDNTSYSCNRIEFVLSALRFENTCNSSNITQNTIGQSTKGLELTANATTGPQTNKGNQWTWDANVSLPTPAAITDLGVWGAINFNTSNINSSQFRTDYSFSGFKPFSINPGPPAQWFIDVPGIVATTCINNGPCGGLPKPPPGLTDLDQKVTTNTFAPTIFPQTTKFDANSITYRKLKEHPNLAPAGSIQALFVLLTSNKAEGKFHFLEEQIKDIYKIPTTTQNLLNAQQTLIEQGLNQIYHLENLWVADTTHRDSLQQLALSISAGLHPIINQHNQTWTAIWLIRKVKATLWGVFNNSIQTQILAEQNTKAVNRIYLQTVAKNEFDFTPNQINTLDQIALQCPTEGGSAVYEARALVTAHTLKDYEALQNCGAGPRQGIAVIQPDTLEELIATSFKVYPNPTDEALTFEWILSEENANSQVILYNTLGQPVQQITLPGNIGLNSISVRDLPTGIYFCKLYANGEIISSQKIIITR